MYRGVSWLESPAIVASLSCARCSHRTFSSVPPDKVDKVCSLTRFSEAKSSRWQGGRILFSYILSSDQWHKKVKGNEFMLVIVPGVDATLPQGWAPSPQGRLVSANREGSHHPQRSGSLSLAKQKS